MSEIYLKVELAIGSSLESVFYEARDLARRLQIPVCFDFNERWTVVGPNEDKERWLKAMRDRLSRAQ